jgi:hypothetical protein
MVRWRPARADTEEVYTPLIALGVITASFAAGAFFALVLGLPTSAVFLAGGVAGIVIPGALAARFFARPGS